MKTKLFYWFMALAIALPLTLSLQSCGGGDDDGDSPAPPAPELPDDSMDYGEYGKLNKGDYVATGNYTNLADRSVKLLCSINLDLLGSEAPKCVFGVYYSTDKASLKNSGTQANGVATGSRYEVVLENLRPSTEYFYCAYLSMNGGSPFFASEVKSFTTSELTLVTGAAKNITTTTADLTFNIDASLLKSAEEMGVVVSNRQNPTVADCLSKLTVNNDGSSSYTAKATKLFWETTYYYCPYILMYYDGKYDYIYGKAKSFTTKGYTASSNTAVDLGLSVKWAACNLDASTPEESGGYYAWGETTTKSEYTENTYFGGLAYNEHGTYKDPLRNYLLYGSLYNVAYSAGEADGIGGTKYDAAHVKLGGKWRMPTKAEMEQLIEGCTRQEMTYKGVKGNLLISKKNENSIFLPYTGSYYKDELVGGEVSLYWTSTPGLYRDNGYYKSTHAYAASIWSEYYSQGVLTFHFSVYDDGTRYIGQTIRPVTTE